MIMLSTPVTISGQITKRIYLDTPTVGHDPTQKIVEFTVSDIGQLIALGTSKKIAWNYHDFMHKVKCEQN